MEKQNMSELGIRDCLTEATLGWKGFGKYNKIRDLYTFNVKYVRDCIRRLIKGGRCASAIKYFESKQCEEILKTFEKPLKINDNDISNISDENFMYKNSKRDEFQLQN